MEQASGSIGCAGWDSGNVADVGKALDDDDSVAAFVCSADTDNAPFGIVNLLDKRDPTCETRDKLDCGSLLLGVPPGMGKIDGSGRLTGDWGGLTRDDLVVRCVFTSSWPLLFTEVADMYSAMNAWKANGKKNGRAQADPTDATMIQSMANEGIRASGLVHIPVCSFYEALDNVLTKKVTASYPCI